MAITETIPLPFEGSHTPLQIANKKLGCGEGDERLAKGRFVFLLIVISARLIVWERALGFNAVERKVKKYAKRGKTQVINKEWISQSTRDEGEEARRIGCIGNPLISERSVRMG